MVWNLNLYLFLISCLSFAVICHGSLVGGYIDIETSRNDVHDAVKFAVTEFNKMANYANLFKPINIVLAKSQVVAGTNYMVVVDIGQTECRKNHAGDACDVENSKVSEVLRCTFKVFQSLPLPESHYELKEHKCEAQ
ncbi:cystatin-C-like [Engystomops pustulosus]|uniref:cystatin-C-like n=1 Tax=Engystomops pustulosus TaxID=76066 RepID=UPI003AFA938D